MTPCVDQVLLDLFISLPFESFTLALLDPLLMCSPVYLSILLEQVPNLRVNLLLLSLAPAGRPTIIFLILSTISCLSLSTMNIVRCVCPVE